MWFEGESSWYDRSLDDGNLRELILRINLELIPSKNTEGTFYTWSLKSGVMAVTSLKIVID